MSEETIIGGISMHLNKKGHWEYNSNVAAKQPKFKQIRVKAPQYRDQPELKALSDLEFNFKKQFRNVTRITVLEIVKFLDNVNKDEKTKP